ncbi:MAG: isochorismatase family cysteine hydrolase [Clostridiales bacterium]|nr:isochorismatase family cysteine hydrolase [Clostridiales bacterium]
MKALLVIDMLKDFIEKSGALCCGDESRRIIPFIKKKIEDFHCSGGLVIFIKDSHRQDDAEFRMFPPHCVKGTRGAEIIDELPVAEGDVIVDKTRYSAFYGTNIEQVLKDRAVTEVHVVGVCTSICVMDTVGDLRNRDYPVVVHTGGVADFDPDAHRFSLRRMEKVYGAIVI